MPIDFIYSEVGKKYRKEEFPILLDLLREQLSGRWVAVLTGVDEKGIPFYVAGTDGTISARKISEKISEITGSQGGGSDRLAKGGGGDPAKFSQVKEALEHFIKE